ncbi:hypothetical protein BKA70DRAFT_1260483 [Coprinopsis sp. MPI-PUGE-AT-0042]|nr:hypothetical protein BKA70DRAFT_1260483 [Coprinopsis sp. MPI-PUGE-AT-0042]
MQTETLTFRPSAVRRKPLFTYKSPSGPSWGPFIDSMPRSLSSTSTNTSATPTPALPSTSSSSAPTSPSKSNSRKQIVIRANPRLPLYHPNGTLALSLPPLDAVALGLPQVEVLLPISVQDDPAISAPRHRSSGRIARSASGERPGMPSVSSIAAVAAREIKDSEVAASTKSPNKSLKRKGAGAGTGGGGKRKRKAVDDTDSSYPAKRTRAPRGAAQSTVADDDQETPGTEANEPTPNPARSASDEPEVAVRTTRSRAKRRSSETPSSDAPAPVKATQEESNDMAVDDITPPITPSAGDNNETPSPVEKDDKEEGELSDT